MKSALCVLVGLTLFTATGSFGRTLYVKPDGSGDAPTIQAGIDSSLNGDTVLLADGTYTGNGNRDIDYHGKAITVCSVSRDPERCIIDCQGSAADPHRGFYFHTEEDENSILRGVTVRNGYAPLSEVLVIECDREILGQVLGRPSSKWGAMGREKEGTSGARGMTRDILDDARAGVLHADEGTRRVRIIVPKPAIGTDVGPAGHASGEAITPLQRLLRLVKRGASPAEGLTSRMELYGLGGGVLCYREIENPAGPTFVQCSFVGNFATDGGGVCVFGSWATFTNCDFLQNAGGGAHYVVEFTGDGTDGPEGFKGCVFRDNEGDGLDGWFAWDLQSIARITDCTFENNSRDGLYCWAGDVELTGCTFSGNREAGAHLEYGRGSILTRCVFEDNRTGIAIYQTNTASARTDADSSKAEIAFSDGYVEIRDCTVRENEFGLQVSESAAELHDCAFAMNVGGGVAVYGPSGLKADGCDFWKNGASGSSPPGFGGMRSSGPFSNYLKLTDCRFWDNSNLHGGGLEITGPLYSGTTIERCVFFRNSGTCGGAVSFGPLDWDHRGRLRFSECTFYQNVAAQGGALYYNCQPPEFDQEEPISLTMLQCTLYGNTADFGGGIYCEGSPSADFIGLKATVIAGSVEGEAVFSTSLWPALKCCDIFGNFGGDWVGRIEDQYGTYGNVCESPLFCDPESGDFGLENDSPCLPPNNPCGVLIGAQGAWCSTGTGIDGDVVPAEGTPALRSFPNPFHPTTRIAYTLANRGFVELDVYDVGGRFVERLVSREQTAGEHVIEWNARHFPSGVYFCRLRASGVVETHRLVLLE